MYVMMSGGGHQVRITKSVCYYSAALETSNILVHWKLTNWRCSFTRVVNYLTKDCSRIWHSVELHKQYILYQGEYLTRRTLLNKSSDLLNKFRSKASKVLKLVSNEDDDHDTAISKVAKLIVVESNTLKQDKSKYKTWATFENSINDVSMTLQHLMSLVLKKLEYPEMSSPVWLLN